MTKLGILCGVVVGLVVGVQPTNAADKHKVWGYVGLETPFGMHPDRPQDNSPAFVGDLHVSNVLGSAGAFVNGEVKLRNGLPYSKEDQFKVGLECPIGKRGLSAYAYYNRRPIDVLASRFMVGFKWGFHSGF